MADLLIEGSRSIKRLRYFINLSFDKRVTYIFKARDSLIIPVKSSEYKEIDVDPYGPAPVITRMKVELISLAQTAYPRPSQHHFRVPQHLQRSLDLLEIFDEPKHQREEIHYSDVCAETVKHFN